jgi:hypothetical protein
MPISWNEIRHNAHAFAKEWADESSEHAEAKSFWDEFFKVFGIKRRTVASFEEPVKKLSGNWGHIDLFWPGKMLVEHKSRDKSLDKANSQAMEYIRGLKDAGRDEEIPRYIVLSDFARIALYDLEEEQEPIKFPLRDLYKHVHAFAFIPGYKQHKLEAEDPINIQAVELLGKLHDALEEGGYTGHDLERFLVRILFCLFAEDTGIFEANAFALYIENHTKVDGSDLGVHLDRYFRVLDTDKPKRQRNLIEELADLPYVNGDLFHEHINFAEFNRAMRDQLLRCTRFDWSRISPAVFGSLFQSVMEPKERRQVGAHYTSERDILKLVRSLFLDDLRAEFEKVKGTKSKLNEFHKKLGGLRFLDPACGCGNFLVVTYRELRLLEMEVLKAIHRDQMVMNIETFALVDVDAMYGIEINEFPARIAEVAMWLIDHQMNQKLSEAFGQYFVRLPLKKSAKIVHANALRTDWNDVLPREKCSYVLGNPPFVGHQWRTDEQQADMALIWGEEGRFGRLDYVTAWYRKAADYIMGTGIRCAFVSTNSICQGEQVGTLWGYLLNRGIKIHFAHRTFPWQSEARGKARVHVIIVGFAHFNTTQKRVYDYDADPDALQAVVSDCTNINPYLVAGSDMILPSRTAPPSGIPQMKKGSQPTDGGHLILSEQDRQMLLAGEPSAAQWIKPYIGGEELINGGNRWCLWLRDADPAQLRRCSAVMERVAKVRESRLKSPTRSVRECAEQPTLFTQDRQPSQPYIAVPEVSSERRRFIPIGFLPATVVGSNKLQMIVGGTIFHFGVLSSTMHMAWVRVVAGRLESRYSYAPSVYNNYPWPQNPTDKQKSAVEAKAQAVLDARAAFPGSSLADLYDPLTMPPKLAKAHAELDRAVDACYRDKPFHSDRERVEFLFELYEKLTAPLTAGLDKKAKRKRKNQNAD